MKSEGEAGANTTPEGAKKTCEPKNVGNITPDSRNSGSMKPASRKGRNRLFTGFGKKRMQSHRLQQKSRAVSARFHSSCHANHHHPLSRPHCLHHHHHQSKQSRRLGPTPSHQFPRTKHNQLSPDKIVSHHLQPVSEQLRPELSTRSQKSRSLRSLPSDSIS